MTYFAIMAAFAAIAVWNMRNARRLGLHLAYAEGLIAAGVPEAEAMCVSGCNWWDQPLRKRIFSGFPPLPERVKET